MKEYEGKSLEELRLEDYVARVFAQSSDLFGAAKQFIGLFGAPVSHGLTFRKFRKCLDVDLDRVVLQVLKEKSNCFEIFQIGKVMREYIYRKSGHRMTQAKSKINKRSVRPSRPRGN